MRAVLAPAWWLRLSSGALCQQLSSSPCLSTCKGCARQHPSLTPSKHEQLCAPLAADAGAGGLPTLCFCPCAQCREQAGTRDSECSSPSFASGAAPRRAGWLCPSCCWPRGAPHAHPWRRQGRAAMLPEVRNPPELWAPWHAALLQVWRWGRHGATGPSPLAALDVLVWPRPQESPAQAGPQTRRALGAEAPGGAGTGTHQPGASAGSGGNRCRA